MFKIINEYILHGCTVIYKEEFESFAECMDYFAYYISLNRYNHSAIKLTLLNVGSWESETYKNVVRSKSV